MLFGVHMHQPTDNFDEVIKKSVEVCYFPFFKTLNKHNFKINFHCSGWLFEKIKKDYKELFFEIKKSYENGLIEFFTGGFYEPILPIIRSEDRVYQIEKLNEFLYKNFKATPKGLWLTERVWEYDILKDLVKCGIEYVVVDDNHFFKAGIKEINGYYLTENEEVLKVFPISKELRYAIPFKDFNEINKLLDKNLVMFDDIEKFGLWPTTYKRVYEENWLDRFFDEFKSEFFSEYVNKNAPLGLAYIKDTSYEEMEEWSGGVFKNFFRKYNESNHLHKRMMNIKNKNESYYKLQTNDVYWHGIFGGIYLPNLRDNAYRYLIEADEKRGVEINDFNLDGKKEIGFWEDDFIYIFNSFGEIIEFSDREAKFNFKNTLKRYKEKYHKVEKSKQKKEVASIHELNTGIDEEILKNLIYDKYEKNMFVDFFIEEKFSYVNYLENDFEIEKMDYDFKVENKKLIFENEKIKKEFLINNEKIDFKVYFDGIYGCEMNFHFANDFLVNNKNFKEEVINEGNLEIKDFFTKRKIIISSTATKIYPQVIKTLSKSEKGFDFIIQGYSFLFIFENKKELNIKVIYE